MDTVLPYGAQMVKRGEILGVLNIDRIHRHTDATHGGIIVLDTSCCVPNCLANPYAPAGTRSVCKDHFLSFLTWRRRRGPQMFHAYAGMSMEERNTIAAEWMKTIRTDDAPAAVQKL